MALKSAKDAGIPINERTMKDGLAFIDSMTDEDTGRTGYIKKGELPVRPEGLQGKFPATESESLTAVAMCSRIFCDADRFAADEGGRRAARARSSRSGTRRKGSIDMYYWYYGTLAMFQMGGEHWERWNKNLKTVVIDNQLQGRLHRRKLGPQGSLGRRRRPRLLDGAHDPLPRGVLPVSEGVRSEEVEAGIDGAGPARAGPCSPQPGFP